MDVRLTIVYCACVNFIWLEIRKWMPLISTRKRSDYSTGENLTDLAALLKQLKNERKGLESEEREARLQRMSNLQHDRLAAQTSEEQEARLQRMSDCQRDRLAAESERSGYSG